VFEAAPVIELNHALHPVFLKTKGYPFVFRKMTGSAWLRSISDRVYFPQRLHILK